MAERSRSNNQSSGDSSGYPSPASSTSSAQFPFPLPFPLPVFPFIQSPIQPQPVEAPPPDFENRCLSCGNLLPPGGHDISCEFCLTASEGFVNSVEHDIPGAPSLGVVDPRAMKKLPEPPQSRGFAKLPPIAETANRVRLAAAAPGTRELNLQLTPEASHEHEDDDKQGLDGRRPGSNEVTPKKRSIFQYVGIAALALTLVFLLRRWRR
uniref:Uncharacterized protein n=1 Tax=Hanusia phi TaxID=3032 RepID=A0A7S0F2Q1_9CRYP|mmetsp:Transcript_36776/g.82867  ORF Transcript_36776/g.82867 Transcript_36776/m.82867 type:complete len:209 (+) Transcript_36776:128-754(+)